MSAVAPRPLPAPRPSWLARKPRPLLLATVLVAGALLTGAVAAYSPRYAVGLVGGGAVMIGVLMSPLFGAGLLVGLAPATSGLVSGFPLPDLRLSEAVIGIIGVTLIATARRRDAVAWKPLDWALLSFGLGWAVFGAVDDFTLHQHLSISDWGTVFGQLQFFLVYRGVRTAVRTARDREIALAVCVASTIPVALLAILQELNVLGVRALLTTMTGGISGTMATATTGSLRATGPFTNWAALAGYLFPVLIVMAAVALSGVRLSRRQRRLFIVAGLLDALALALSQEQSISICLIIGVVLLVRSAPAAERLRRWMGIGGGVVAAAASPVLIARFISETASEAGTNRVSWIPQTLQFRWMIWTDQYVPAILNHIFTGFGVVYPSTISWTAPESQYIACLMEGGVPMLILFLLLAWVMFTTARDGITSELADPLQQAMCRAMTIAVVAMMVVCFIWEFLSAGGMPQVLWALLALAIPTEHPGAAARPGWNVGRQPRHAESRVVYR